MAACRRLWGGADAKRMGAPPIELAGWLGGWCEYLPIRSLCSLCSRCSLGGSLPHTDRGVFVRV